MIAIVAFIVFVERSERRIPVQYAKRIVGRRLMGGQSTHLPLKVNSGGVMPVIFASSIRRLHAACRRWHRSQGNLGPFFQGHAPPASHGTSSCTWSRLSSSRTSISRSSSGRTISQTTCGNMADSSRAFAPVRARGLHQRHTDAHHPGGRAVPDRDFPVPERLITGIHLNNAYGWSAASSKDLPVWVTNGLGVNFYFGGTSLLIVVGVAMDTVNQVESQLIMRHYEGFSPKSGRIRGRRNW